MKTFFSLKAQFQLLERGRTVAGFVMNVENNAIFVQEKKNQMKFEIDFTYFLKKE